MKLSVKISLWFIVATMSVTLFHTSASSQVYIDYVEFDDGTSPASIARQLGEVRSEIELLDKSIENFNDVENLRYEIQKYKGAITYYDPYVNKNDETYQAYEDCNKAYFNLLQKVDELTALEQKQKTYRKTSALIASSLQKMEALEKSAKDFFDKKNDDSLAVVKKQAETLVQIVNTMVAENNEALSDYPDITDDKAKLEAKKAMIDSMEIKKRDIGDLIFKGVVVFGILFGLVNMLIAKREAAKAMKASGIALLEKESKNKDIPTI